MERTSEYHFVLKTHPRSSVQAPQIYDQLRGVSGATYEVATESFYDLLPRADVVIATYSSAGMEASSLGYPVIALHMPEYASPSGLMDAGGSVRFAASPEALMDELAAVGTTPRDDAASSVFWELDGQAQTRWADTIARLVKGHASR
jgi:CDP-glycerol glycerophosphotransferase (TagB/SpsB family)